MASRRLIVLDFIRRYIARHGQSPSLGEVAAGAGCSRTAAHKTVRRLVRSGDLLKTAGPRGLALPGQKDEAARLLRRLGCTVDLDRVTDCPLPERVVLDYQPGHGKQRKATGTRG